MNASGSSSVDGGGVSLWHWFAHTPIRDVVRGRMTGRLDLGKTIAESGLPRPVQDLVLRVVRSTRLHRLERADVASELIAHFADGSDCGTTPESLIESFGDPAQAAKLIRRARRRQRPLLWKAWRRSWQATLAVLGVMVVAYFFSAARMFFSSPSPSHDYLTEINLVADSTPVAERAWPTYRSALLALEPFPAFEATGTPSRAGDAGWEELAAYLERNASALATARTARGASSLGFALGRGFEGEDGTLWPDLAEVRPLNERGGTLIDILLPHLGQLNKLQRVLVADTHLAASEGDGARATANLLTLTALAGHLREAPILICDLVSLSIVDRTCRTISEVLADSPDIFDDGQLVDVAHALSAVGDGQRLAIRYNGEGLMFRDVVQHTYTDDGHGDGFLTAEGLRLWLTVLATDPTVADWMPIEEAAFPALGLLAPGRRALIAEYDRVLARIQAEMEKPLWQRSGEILDDEAAKFGASGFQSGRFNPVLALVPALEKAATNVEYTELRRGVALAVIALQMHHRRHGVWPESLAELTPSPLPAVSIDPFDGGRLKYRLVDGSPRVYSAGGDRDDDGGRMYVTSTGRPDNVMASAWFSAEQLEIDWPAAADRELAIRNRLFPPDADWVLWPDPIK